jgi:hypothetical protein
LEQVEKALKALEWFDKVKSYLTHFKPDITHVSINFREKACEIRLHIHVPQGLRRRIHKIEIPAYQGFRVKEMTDPFAYVKNGFYFEDGKWKMDPNLLPASEHYLVYLEGKMDSSIIDKIVRVQPATNRDSTEELDRYWLDAMIRDVQLLEKIWQHLEIEDVDISVKLSIDRCFYGVLPSDLKERIEATQKFLEAGKTLDRERVLRAWFAYRKALKKSTISVDEVVKITQKLTEPDTFTNYLSVDNPYRIGGVFIDETFRRRIFPELITVNARTDLSFKTPVATGYLTFKKKAYTDVIKQFLDKL